MDAKPTMADVARAAGVSRPLVSIVFRDAPGASPATRRKVLAAAEEIGYRRNSLAARLASHTTNSLGVLLFDMRSDLTADVFEGIRQEADRRDFGVVVGISDPGGEHDERAINDLVEARVDAIILISSTMPGSELRSLGRTLPIVSVTRRVDGADSVICDEQVGGSAVVDHLVALGHRRITHLAPTWRPSARVASYEAAMQRAGLEPDVVDIAYDYHDDTMSVTRSLLARQSPPTAIYANNDTAAYAVLEALHESGRRVPDDVAVAGYDNLRVSAMAAIALTSVDQNPRAMGAAAVRTALARIEDREREPQLEILRPRLVVRRSTAGPRA